MLTGTTTIDLAKAIRQKKLIIFNLSKGKLGSKTSRIYGKFVLTTLFNIMLARADIPEEFRTPCHFYIDEFSNYSTDSIQEIFCEGRKYKAYLTVATQIIGQNMNTELRKIILGNVNVKIIGKAGYESRDAMLKQMGFNATEEKILKNKHYFLPQFLRRKPVTMRTFKKLKVGKFIVQVDNYTPQLIINRKSLLGNKRSMSDKQREQFLETQLEKYYVPPFIYTPTPLTNPTEEYNPFQNGSKSEFFLKEKNAL